jgi:uncharacterized membrane protein
MENSENGKTFLYLGDDSVKGAACYLAGIMSYYGFKYIHVPSDTVAAPEVINKDWDAVIISDYPSSNWNKELLEILKTKVESGKGLLMFGGWESYHGKGGDYDKTVLSKMLPVQISSEDDRVNSYGPCLIYPARRHFITENLPFESETPGIGGFNRVSPKENSEIVLEAKVYEAQVEVSESSRHGIIPLHVLNGPVDTAPLLVTGTYGKGRTVAWTTDVAPHWIGGLVDWGDKRVESKGTGDAESIEVGNWYAELFRNMLLWAAGENEV